MTGVSHFHRQRGSKIVSFVYIGDPATDANGAEGFLQRWHLQMQIFGHRRATRFVIRQKLMTPTRLTIVTIKNRHHVRGLSVA
jgi:hypothetical protein